MNPALPNISKALENNIDEPILYQFEDMIAA